MDEMKGMWGLWKRWFAILPGGKNRTCLGLLDKYAGFSAVEYVYENENRMSAVIRRSERVGWISEKTPSSVMINGKDFTKGYERSENVYVADFPETDSKMLLSVSWDNIGEMEHRN